MKKKIIITLAILAVIGIGVVLYMFNMPHRDVASSKVDFKVMSTELVNEFVKNKAVANEKYLAEDGDSRIMQVTGRVDEIKTDQLGQKVVMLKNEGDNMGVSVTFTLETNDQLASTKVGYKITIKGVIRSGAEYDEDLELYEDAIIEKASLLK